MRGEQDSSLLVVLRMHISDVTLLGAEVRPPTLGLGT